MVEGKSKEEVHGCFKEKEALRSDITAMVFVILLRCSPVGSQKNVIFALSFQYNCAIPPPKQSLSLLFSAVPSLFWTIISDRTRSAVHNVHVTCAHRPRPPARSRGS